MSSITLRSCKSKSEWDDIVLNSEGHPLQLWGWGETKAAHNWSVDRVIAEREGKPVGAAQLLIRRLPGPLGTMAYIPRGPVCSLKDAPGVLEQLAVYTKRTHGAIVLTIEPDWEEMPEVDGWKRSSNTILIPRTLILDLHKSEDELLAAMAKKTRQYIRKSEKEGIEIRRAKTPEDIGACLEIYKQTSERAGFGIHDDVYYQDIFANLGDHSPVFIAYCEDRAVAFLWLAISQSTAFELYGGMNDEGQRLRANYTLKWHAITTMKKWGIDRYDFNGLLNDGVSTFKQGFANHENMLVGTYDRPLSPLYVAWDKGLPAAKTLIRKLRR